MEVLKEILKAKMMENGSVSYLEYHLAQPREIYLETAMEVHLVK